MARAIFAVITVMLAFILACQGEAEPTATASTAGPSAKRLKVVTTVSPITSIVESIGGNRIDLRGLVPEGVNSHTFEPAPSVAALLADADVVFLNGLFLEEPTLEMARANQKPGASIVALGDQAISQEDWRFDFSFPQERGHPNPHLWPDPILALRYAEIVRDGLGDRDPDNALYYSVNYEAFEARVVVLDQAIRTMVASIPADKRKLLTYHDSWAYFADRYGMTVIGAVQPSDFSEPSVREVAELVRQIESEGLTAVFGSEVFSSDVLETIADESGAAYVDELRDDDLPGAPGDPTHSYLGLAVSNLRTMISALGGDASALDGFDVSQVFDGETGAVYPQ